MKINMFNFQLDLMSFMEPCLYRSHVPHQFYYYWNLNVNQPKPYFNSHDISVKRDYLSKNVNSYMKSTTLQ